ncbi:MAG: leucine-rich repeat domain-containing protein [Verrucomicrobiota bacterium]|nr:leucine-rich repeat domain-containing protein [Verrucomicrobiota bacterium]
MKVNGNFVNLSDIAGHLAQAAGQDFQFSIEGERVRVVAASSLNSPQAAVADLQGRLERAGYSQFVVRFSSAGMVIVDGKSFEQELEQWVRNEGGKAAEVANIIRRCFYSGSVSLELSGFKLRTLPPVLDKLEHLENLNLSKNRLTTFSIPDTLFNLVTLGLFRNRLTSFSIPAELVNLKVLDLSHNQLTVFSVPGEARRLEVLKLDSNRLSVFSVPAGCINLMEINLGNNKLTNFLVPPECSRLEILKLSRNRLTAFFIPAECINLLYLDLSFNRLTAFLVPAECINLQQLRLPSNQLSAFFIPTECVNLQYLDLSFNRLTAFSVPAECINLQGLNLSSNDLASFSALGTLDNLQFLACNTNFELQTLPLSLGHCINLTDIDIDGTNVPSELRHTILATCQECRTANALNVLPSRLNSWVIAGGQSLDLTFINGLIENERITINEWLTRLEKTRDFTANHQQSLARIVCGMLLSIKTNSAFKEAFFAQVPVNLENCEDRAAMAFNELYLSWKLATLPGNVTLQDKLRLMQSAAKTLALRKELSRLFAEREEKESVEIYLYYELALQRQLQLLTAFQSMTYAHIGRRDWINEDALVAAVNNAYLDELCDLPQIKELADKDSQFVAERSSALNTFNNRLEAISESLSDTEYTRAMKTLQEERGREEGRLLRKWVTTKLAIS